MGSNSTPNVNSLKKIKSVEKHRIIQPSYLLNITCYIYNYNVCSLPFNHKITVLKLRTFRLCNCTSVNGITNARGLTTPQQITQFLLLLMLFLFISHRRVSVLSSLYRWKQSILQRSVDQLPIVLLVHVKLPLHLVCLANGSDAAHDTDTVVIPRISISSWYQVHSWAWKVIVYNR